MAGVPPTPRPARKGGRKAPSREPVTPVTTDTPPEPGSGPTLEEAIHARMATPNDPPPPPPSATAARKGRATKADKLQDSLAELLSMPALAYAAAGDEWAASFVAERAPVMAEAWVSLGQENPAVMRVLQRITTTSAWGGVVMATGGTVLPLLIHHDLLPDIGLPLGGGVQGGPIVPPPPTEGPPPPGPATTGGAAVGRQPPPPGGFTDMTPPLSPGAPPGVVTVASTNNQAVNLPD